MKRIFISFAVEDRILRDFMIGHRNNVANDIEFADYSVKEPWNSAWKTNCRTRIRGCDGLIALITPNTPRADGQLWEIKCAYDESVPVLLIHGYPDKRPTSIPLEIKGRVVNAWTWDRVSSFVKGL